MAQKIKAGPTGRFPMGMAPTVTTISTESEVARAIEDYRHGQLEDAVTLLESIIADRSAEPEPPEWLEVALAARGEAERRLGNTSASLEAFTQAIDVAESTERTTGCAYAISLFGADRIPEATALLEECVTADPDPEALLHLAEIRLKEGSAEEAVELAEAALQAMPDDLLSHEVYAEALLALNQIDESWSRFDIAADLALDRERWEYAAHLLRRGTETGVAELEQTVARAWEFVQNGQPAWAESVVDAVLDATPSSPFALGAKGQLMVIQDDFAAAENYYQQSIDVAPEYTESRWGLGEAIRLQDRPEEAVPIFQQVIEEQPQWPMPFISIAAAEIELGNLDVARSWLNQALALDPENAWAAAFLGVVEERVGAHDAAIASYRSAIEQDPTISWAYEPLARLSEESGLLREAVEVVDLYLAREPGDASALICKGELQLQMDNVHEAIATLKAAWDVDPESAGEALATAFAANDEEQKIERLVAEMLEINPETPWALEWQGRLSRGSHHRPESVERLRKSVYSNPQRESSYQPLVEGLYDIGEREGAKSVLVEFLEMFGDKAWALEKLAMHLFDDAQDADDFDSARKLFDRAEKAGSTDPAMLSAWGETFRMLGDYPSAKRLLEAALSADPYNVRTLRRLGYAELGLANARGALGAFRQAVELAPQNPDVLRDVVVGYTEISDLDAALRSARELVEMHPDYARGLATLGTILVITGRFDDAIETLESAIALDADLPDGWGDLGFAAELTGDNDRAAYAYQRAVDLNRHDWTSRVGHAEMTSISDANEGKKAYSQIINELNELSDDGDGRAWMGWCHYRLGEFDRAIELYDEALTADRSKTFVYFDRGLARLSIGDSAATEDYEQGVSESYGYQSIRQEGLLAVALAELRLAIDEQESLAANPDAAWAADLLEDVLTMGPTSTMS